MATISLRKIWRLGIKELWSLVRDPVMLGLILYTFTAGIYMAATAQPDTLTRASLAIVDEDGAPLSLRIRSAFSPPQFMPPELISLDQADGRLDRGRATFVLVIPAGFQRRVLAGRDAALQLNVDATRMSVILTGAALIREREHGTVEHLLVMPVSPLEIMLAKLWSMAAVVLLASLVALLLILQALLHVGVQGSAPLFMAGATLHLFATTSLGILLAMLARSMPQFGLLVILVLLPLNMLSGANTPRESIPFVLRELMLLAPTTHFVELSQAILFRGAGLGVVWRPFLALLGIGGVLFGVSLARFGRAMRQG